MIDSARHQAPRPGLGLPWWRRALLLTALLAIPGLSAPPPLRADSWKACAFNDQPVGCRDSHSPDGSVTIRWQDGAAMTYRLLRQSPDGDLLEDRLGGRWQRQLFPQGNALFTNPANGNTILVPLR